MQRDVIRFIKVMAAVASLVISLVGGVIIFIFSISFRDFISYSYNQEFAFVYYFTIAIVIGLMVLTQGLYWGLKYYENNKYNVSVSLIDEVKGLWDNKRD